MYESRREDLKRLSSTNMYNSVSCLLFFFFFFASSVVFWLVVFAFQIRGRSVAKLRLLREGKGPGII